MADPDSTDIKASFRFEHFELNGHERQLLANGVPVMVGSRALDVLLALAQRPGKLVTKNELLDLVWPGLVVEEHNIATQISTLRKILGNGLIATVPGRGYRFTAHVRQLQEGGSAPVTTHAPDRRQKFDKENKPSKYYSNLPAILTTMIGRETEFTELRELVLQHALVSVIGAGGIGKTLLVQTLIDSMQPSFEHGVCWVDLAGLNDSDALPAAIAVALGAPLGTNDPLTSLISAVVPLQVLLALDNAEHLLKSVSHVADTLLAAAPRLKIIVTSQAPLQLRAEHLFRLGGLSVPDKDGLALPSLRQGQVQKEYRPGDLRRAQALEFGAVSLFVERAKFADRHFELTDTNAQAVCWLCQRLDGCALAIELAAARLPVLGINALLDSLDRRMQVLTRGHRNAPVRQQTLRNTLDWSHALLDPQDQVVFRRMAVFKASAALADILYVVAFRAHALSESETYDAGGDDWAALDSLTTLVDRSLVSLVAVPSSDEPRYRLLETPRAYALEQLATAGESDATQHRHAQAMSKRMDPLLTMGLGREDLQKGKTRPGTDPDLDNLTAAWSWALMNGDAEVGLKTATALLLELPMSMYSQKVGIAQASAIFVDTDQPPALRMWFWWGMSWHWASVRRQESLDAARKSLAAARETDPAPGHAVRLHSALGLLALATSRFDNAIEAASALAEMNSIVLPEFPPGLNSTGLECAAYALPFLGKHAESVKLLRELYLNNQALDRNNDLLLGNLADAELAAGNAKEAVRIGVELLALADGTRNGLLLAYECVNLCAARLALDQIDEATVLAQRGWADAARLELYGPWGDYLALLAALQQRFEIAAQIGGYANSLYQRSSRQREPNEKNASRRARSLAEAALGKVEYERLSIAGKTLHHDEVGRLAFSQ